MAYPFDLGDHSFPITTSSPVAQKWFDRGLLWTYGFNHEEAVLCFGEALKADPDCAMAHWGIGYAAGPNYNMPWEKFDERNRRIACETGHDSSREALARIEEVAPWEAAVIRALPKRYQAREPLDDMTAWTDAYADAMRQAFAAHPESLEIRALLVEALMQRTPWKMWDLARGVPASGADTAEAQAVCEEGLEDPRAWTHPGLLHLYVHLMEMSPTPERALKAGDVLRTLVPDAGHLIHMPTHIDVLCGHYRDVVHWNEIATEADLKFWRLRGAENRYTGYRIHNYHFTIYGAMFLGQAGPALAAVRGAEATFPEEILRIESPPMADYFESYLSFEPHVLVRFGMWEEALAMPLPDDRVLYCTKVANIFYARGIARASMGQVVDAEAEQRAFEDARNAVPETRLLHNNRVVDILRIASAMLEGEIAYRKGDHELAFAELRRAVALEDGLPYDEPWGWMQPVRHALGALLLEQGHIEEAEAAFRADLGLGGQASRAMVHPDNVWALRGLRDCLAARGETVERIQVEQRLARAEARADRAVAAACFCARAAGAA